MATTGFWPVKSRLKEVIDYVENPDKTIDRKYVDSDLYAALQYAADDKKADKRMYVSGINCNANTNTVLYRKRSHNRITLAPRIPPSSTFCMMGIHQIPGKNENLRRTASYGFQQLLIFFSKCSVGQIRDLHNPVSIEILSKLL